MQFVPVDCKLSEERDGVHSWLLTHKKSINKLCKAKPSSGILQQPRDPALHIKALWKTNDLSSVALQSRFWLARMECRRIDAFELWCYRRLLRVPWIARSPNQSILRESENEVKWSRSVVSDSSRPHGLQPTSLLRPWDFPGKNTGVGCHFLLQCIRVKWKWSRSVVSDSLWPHGLQHARLLCRSLSPKVCPSSCPLC